MTADGQAGSLRKGIACLVASAFFFALMGALVHGADACGGRISAIQKSFFRNLVAWGVAGALLARLHFNTHAPLSFANGDARTWGWLLLRAVCGTVGVFGNFYALSHLPVADALMLNKLAPFFTVLFSWALLKERLTRRQAFCLLGAFAGAMLVVKPGVQGLSPLPALGGLLGGIGAGAAYTCLRELGRLRISGAAIVFFFSGFSTLAACPFMFFAYDPMTPLQVAVLLGAGLAAAMGQFAVTAAYRYAPARRIAAWDYTNILFGALFGWLFFGQTPDLFSAAGFVTILAMAIALRGR